ncbi:MAG: hypothetical protein ACKVI3_07880, partial [Verrucomicrobiia bacterium]
VESVLKDGALKAHTVARDVIDRARRNCGIA